MKISIITAVYNRKTTIAQAIESLQRQTYRNYEHIIIDGGSTDGTLDEIELRLDQKTKMTSGPDRGIYDALNKGINYASGDVVGLMHSDDFFANDSVLEQIAEVFEDKSVDGAYGDLDYVSENDISHVIRHWRSGTFGRHSLARGWMPPHPTLYMRREVFEKFGDYDTSYTIAADYDAMMRWLGAGQIKLAYIPQVLVKMRGGGQSNRSIRNIIQKTREDYRIIRSNNIGGLGTLLFKNARKIRQFFEKPE